MNIINNKLSVKARIYQYRNSNYLPDTSQPDVEKDYELIVDKYAPHKSTRYINVVIGINGKAQRRDKSGNLIESDRELPEIYEKRENCCGCSACYAICSVRAIMMKPDEQGFLYPVVDAEKCIRCYKCLSVCDFKKSQKSKDYL